MFVCDPCHKRKYGTKLNETFHSGSFGPCEVCGLTGTCADCHGHIIITLSPERSALLEKIKNASDE